ncbi:MAG TPA: anthranilate phosphoribosyltransferase, partial [Nocardioides sp.]
LDPRDFGLPLATVEDLRGGDTQHNADVVRRLLDGEQGPVRDAVVLNTGAALAVFDGDLDDLPGSLASGIERARTAIDSGAAKATLDKWVKACAAG